VDKRVFGLRSEYSVVCTAGGQRQLSWRRRGAACSAPSYPGGQGRQRAARERGGCTWMWSAASS